MFDVPKYWLMAPAGEGGEGEGQGTGEGEGAGTGTNTGEGEGAGTGEGGQGEGGQGTGEGEGAGTGEGQGEGEGEGEGDGEGAPESYADFELPEGITADEESMNQATETFKELGLNQAQAQKAIDLYANLVQAGAERQTEAFSQLMDDWKNQSKNDSEFGGEHYEESVKIARQAIDKFGTDELKTLLNDHGIGNHPEMVRFMLKVGKTIQEDNPGGAGVGSGESKDRTSVLYPND